MMELWDAYLENWEKAGCDLVRGEPIPEGLFHLSTRILLRHADGDYLAMRRDPNKMPHAGKLEATAGGSALKGETALECAVRELTEETGLLPRDVISIGRFSTHNTHFEAFIATTDSDKSSVTLQAGETVEYLWMNERELIKLLSSDESIPTGRECYLAYFNDKNK